MTRLSFKPEFVGPVLRGEKRFTSRWKPVRGIEVGDTVAAVTSREGKPAFLTPASDAFCRLLIVSHEEIRWADFTDADAARCGVSRDWYLRERPDPHWADTLHVYGFLPVGKAVEATQEGEANG